jgi:phosphoribosylformylglycinamidine synthase
VDLAAERRLAELLAAEAAGADRAISSAHDLSDGGLAQALVEACLIGQLGAEISLPTEVDPFVALFSESSGRVLVTVRPERMVGLIGRAEAAGVPVRSIGTVTERDDGLALAGLGTLSIDALDHAWQGTLPALFNN